MPSKPVKGFLYIIVVEAKGLPNIGQGTDAIDSFCSVFLDNMEEGTTVPAFDTMTPVWNKKFKIKVVGQYNSLDVQMFDATVDGNHLGFVSIDLDKAFSGEPLDVWLDLKARPESHHKYPVSGSLHLQIQYSEYKPAGSSSTAAPAAASASATIVGGGVGGGGAVAAEEKKADDANLKALQEAAMAAELQAKADADRKKQQELEAATAKALADAAAAAEADRERAQAAARAAQEEQARATAQAAAAQAEAERARQQAITSDQAADLLRLQMQQAALQHSMSAQRLAEEQKLHNYQGEQDRRRAMLAQRMTQRDTTMRAYADQQQAAISRRQRIMQDRMHTFVAGEPPLQQTMQNMFGALGGFMNSIVGAASTGALSRGILDSSSAQSQQAQLPIQLEPLVQDVPGLLVDVAVGAQVWGVNGQGSIYRRDGEDWSEIPGALSVISTAEDGSVWGVNSLEQIYKFENGNWINMQGALRHISCGSAEHIWGINSQNMVFRFEPLTNCWISIPCPFAISSLSVGSDGFVAAVALNQQIYYYDNGNWILLPGALVWISVENKANIVGCNAQGQVWRFTFPQHWQCLTQITGIVTRISVGSSGLWFVGPDQSIRKINAVSLYPNLSMYNAMPNAMASLNCQKCNGLGNIGTFGPCTEGDMHCKGKCPTCRGVGKTSLQKKCTMCNGLGGQGTFGPCEIFPQDVHFKLACGTCSGLSYTN